MMNCSGQTQTFKHSHSNTTS